jgi:RecB family endonuclease NucS
MLNEEQIRYLILKFKESNTYLKWHKHRVERHQFNSKWINPDSVQSLTDDELRQRFLNYYKGGEGRQTLNQIYRDRIVRDISRFRMMLLYLLNEKIPIEQRFQSVVEGDFHIEGVGKGLASALLMDFNMDKYCLWNNKTEMGWNVLGWQAYDPSDDIGVKYVKVLTALKKLRDNIVPELKLTFDDVDFFLHFISAEEEGIRLIQTLTEEKEITVPSPGEEFIQKIIEEKFDEIIGNKLGLELYQEDPESSGSQYSTSVGRIDFLTKDKKTGDFVVIELKCGKATDGALSQILRYMGWTKDNLAKGKNVKGLILAEGIDERLKFALKFVQNVEVLTYKVSLQIEKPKS